MSANAVWTIDADTSTFLSFFLESVGPPQHICIYWLIPHDVTIYLYLIFESLLQIASNCYVLQIAVGLSQQISFWFTRVSYRLEPSNQLYLSACPTGWSVSRLT